MRFSRHRVNVQQRWSAKRTRERERERERAHFPRVAVERARHHNTHSTPTPPPPRSRDWNVGAFYTNPFPSPLLRLGGKTLCHHTKAATDYSVRALQRRLRSARRVPNGVYIYIYIYIYIYTFNATRWSESLCHSGAERQLAWAESRISRALGSALWAAINGAFCFFFNF